MASNVVFFDGTCNLCNGFIDYLIVRKPTFSFASIQGESAQKILPEGLRHQLSTVIYFRDGEFLTESEAVIQIFKDLGGKHKILAWMMSFFPMGFANWVYRSISKNRYRLFGKRKSCRLPEPFERDYFLP